MFSKLKHRYNKTFFQRRKNSFIPIPKYNGTSGDDFAHSLCAAAIIKDEAPYLKEWIEFHCLVGFEHFIIYDNASTDNPERVLQPYIDEGLVRFVPWPHFYDMLKPKLDQNLAYAHAITLMRGQAKWLALLDLDEFCFSPETDNLCDVLKDYEDLSAMAAFDVVFGSAGLETKPDGVLHNFTSRLSDEKIGPQDAWAATFKTILQPHKTSGVFSAHRFEISENPVRAWTERRQPIYDITVADGKELLNIRTCERLRVNHYFCKSKEEYYNRRVFSGNNTFHARKQTGIYDARFKMVNTHTVFDDTILELRDRLMQTLEQHEQ